MSLAVPTVVIIIAVSAPYLTTAHMPPPHSSFRTTWVQFVGVILALIGVEAVANLTGVMKLDRGGATLEQPKVKRTATLAILPVAAEMVIGTTLIGWAMLSIPRSQQLPDSISLLIFRLSEPERRRRSKSSRICRRRPMWLPGEKELASP